MSASCDIFCAVVDNFGDAGVCWRLARQLAREHGWSVRLWIDDVAALGGLRPGVDAALDAQKIEGVEIRRWREPFPLTEPAQIVVEAFACELPRSYLAAMAQRQPVWINLEYLSAEDWVTGCHGMASPHPQLPLTKHFFFPGFSAGTGGLLREADYDRRRVGFDGPAFRRDRLGLPDAPPGALTVSLFGYENAALSGLLDAWCAGSRPVELLVPEGRLTSAVAAHFGRRPWRQGSLAVHPLPFLPQPDYDELLWLSDLNFVRGEDSFVRAQWAEKPFVWHIYPQQDRHHRIKFAAFLDRWLARLEGADDTAQRDAASSTRHFWYAWEEGEAAGKAWPDFSAALPVLAAHGRQWAEELQRRGDLAGNLMAFVAGLE